MQNRECTALPFLHKRCWDQGKGNIYVFICVCTKELWRETQENNNIWPPVGRGNGWAGEAGFTLRKGSPSP